VKQYRFALQTVVAKEAKAYGFAIVVWCTGAFLIIERGKPTAGAVLAFAGAALLAQMTNVLLAFGKPTRTWQGPNQREYVWTTFHALPVAAGVLVAWALAAGLSGMWAYFVAPLVSILLYQLLLGAESLFLSAEDRVESVTKEMGDENPHSS
jgi:hypothetical protein